MSLYSEYIKERLGDEIIETKKGFLTYRYLNSGVSLYIVDIYVKPEFRKKNIATELVSSAEKIAREKGCSELIGSVVPSANNSTNGLKFCLSIGMSLKNSTNDFVVLKKDLV